MFDFAWSHILLLLLVAVIFLGPKELPVVLRYLGKIFAKLKQHREELQEYVDAAINHPNETTKQIQPLPVKKAELSSNSKTLALKKGKVHEQSEGTKSILEDEEHIFDAYQKATVSKEV